MNEHDGNVAFKCTYNDGGDRGFVGFGGTCSDGNILRNVKTNPKRWCSDPSNLCRKFCDNGFRGKRPEYPCYESGIIKQWRFGPGTYQTEDREGEPIPMKHAQTGKVALLTTRHPERDTESERIVFGVYKIERVSPDERGMILVEGSADHAIRVSESAAFTLPYWRYKRRRKGTTVAWGSNLFRYLSDREVTNFLHALRPLLQSAQDRTVLEELLECCGNLEPERDSEEENGEVPEFGAEAEIRSGRGRRAPPGAQAVRRRSSRTFGPGSRQGRCRALLRDRRSGGCVDRAGQWRTLRG